MHVTLNALITELLTKLKAMKPEERIAVYHRLREYYCERCGHDETYGQICYCDRDE